MEMDCRVLTASPLQMVNHYSRRPVSDWDANNKLLKKKGTYKENNAHTSGKENAEKDNQSSEAHKENNFFLTGYIKILGATIVNELLHPLIL